MTFNNKVFLKHCNRIRALISFRKITTFAECIKELGIEHLGLEVSGDIPLSPSSFNEFIKQVEPKLRAALCKEVSKVESNYWNETDSLIESTIYKGYKPLISRRDELLALVPPRNPNQRATCLYFQMNCALEAYYAITQQKKDGILIRANTGDGKTFFAGQLIRWILDSGILEEHSFSPWKILYVTGASIVGQTTQDLTEEFGIDCVSEVQVANYESLRSSFGLDRYLERKIIVEQGEEHEVWEWRKMIHPCLVIWDECHKLKNEGSIQSKIAQACNNLDYVHPFTKNKARIIQVFMSASPFSRVAHAKAFACATKHTLVGKDGSRLKVTNKNWKAIAQSIAGNADLNEYSRAAIEKFLREFKEYIFPFKNVRRKHKGILITEFLDFLTEEDAKKYELAWETFVEFQEKLKGMKYDNSEFLLLVQLNVFRQAAEIIRYYHVAKYMYEAHTQGFAPVAAFAYKASLAKSLMCLVNDFNIPRSKISVIWGGSNTYSGNKGVMFTKEQIHEVLRNAIRDPESISLKTIKQIHNQLQAEQEGLIDIPKNFRLGIQSKEQRDEERKNFQSGRSEFCFFTFGAGKEGLSLHQNQDYLRPRKQFNTPVYNEMEMLQAEGRTARITSLSDTEILTLVYKNTIEVPVLRRVLAKRQCLEVVRSHGDKMDDMSKELEAVMKLAGMSDNDEDEDVEEGAHTFEQLEQEDENEE
jgi:hypothetical protein